MSTSQNSIIRAWLLGIVVIAAGSRSDAAEEPSKTPPPQTEDEAQEVVVTGTNLKSGFTQAAPVQVVDRETLESYGTQQFSDVLKSIPSNTGTELYNEGTNRAGTAQFNLRGLGFSSTLTLINGRRAGFAPISDRSGGDFVDINQFPLAMVQRVEVLKDGASSIYGSEAVAGVVNIITRKGFSGFELSGGYADATNHSGFLNLAAGGTLDRGSFNVYATYYTQNGNKRTDFDWLVERVGGNGVPGRSLLLSTNGHPSNYRRAILNGDGTYSRMAGAAAFADPDCEAAGGVFRINDNGSVDTSTCRFDFADQVSIIPSAERMQSFAEFDYALSSRVKFLGEAGFSRNVSKTVKGPGGYANGLIADSGDVVIPGSHPFNFFIADPVTPTRLVYVGPENWNPAIHTAVDVSASFRPLGVELTGDNAPQRRSESDYFRMASGLQIDLSSQWDGSLFYTYSGATFNENEPLDYNADILNQFLLDGTYNPFGTEAANPTLVSPKDGVSVASNSAQIERQIQATSVRTARTRQKVIDAIVRGEISGPFEQDIGLAIGAQFRTASLNDTPDSLSAAGEARVGNFETAAQGQQDVKAGFIEAGLQMFDALEVQLALRHEDYGGGVGATTDPKISARFAATDWLALRSSWGTSFQAPTLRQLASASSREFINDSATFTSSGLVCMDSGRTGNVLITVSGDKNLKPQSSKNLNLGLVLEPLNALRFSVDFWRYDYTDLIAPGATGQAIILNDCADDGIPNDPRIIRGGDGLIREITTSFVNVGEVLAEGVDITAQYRLPLERIGGLDFNLQATQINTFDVKGGEGGVFSGLGSRNFSNNFAPMPRWRAVGSVAWSLGVHQAMLTARFIDSYENDQSNNANVDSMTTFDLQYALDLSEFTGSRTTLSIGADNVFDTDPPALTRNDANGNRIPTSSMSSYDRPGYDSFVGHDLRGRVLYLKASHRF